MSPHLVNSIIAEPILINLLVTTAYNMTVFDILIKYHQAFLGGLMVTCEMCLIIWSTGLILGSLLGILAAKWRLILGVPARLIAFILSGMPMLVFLFWLHYPL